MENAELTIHHSVLRTNAKQRFVYENIAFGYHLMLEPRKTISATVYPNQSVIVKAPLGAKAERINEFLMRKYRWVLKQRRYFSQFKPINSKEYVTGESFRYLGRSYKLLVRDTNAEPYVSLQHGTLTVYSLLTKNRLQTKQLLDDWYIAKAHKIFYERLTPCFGLFNYENIPSLGIRKLNKRWGSFLHKSNRIILNQDLIKASKSQIDYVIIHELCHVQHNRHDRNFYALLASKLPNWENIKTELELRLLSAG